MRGGTTAVQRQPGAPRTVSLQLMKKMAVCVVAATQILLMHAEHIM